MAWKYICKFTLWQLVESVKLLWHPKGICENEGVWLDECRRRVRGYDGVPGFEEPLRLTRSIMARQQRVSNHTDCVDPLRLGKSVWGTTQIVCMYQRLARVCGTMSWERYSVFCIMRWCLSTPWSPKYMIPIAQSISVISLCPDHLSQSLFWLSLNWHIPDTSITLPNRLVVRNGLFCHHGLPVHRQVVSICISRYSSNYTRIPSAAKLSICI